MRRLRILWHRWRMRRAEKRLLQAQRWSAERLAAVAQEASEALEYAERRRDEALAQIETMERTAAEREHEIERLHREQELDRLSIDRLTSENKLAEARIQCWTAAFAQQIAKLDKDVPIHAEHPSAVS